MLTIIFSAMALFFAMSSASSSSSPSERSRSICTVDGHDAVDLGLPSGTLWATCNVGAKFPEFAGHYYAWGDIKSQENKSYSWPTYKWCKGTKASMTKYCTDSKFGTVDHKTELDDADDVAAQRWGGKWRMPTHAQQKELIDNCYWVWVKSYNYFNVNGYIVFKAKSDSDKGVVIKSGATASSYDVAKDDHIFLPAAGFCYEGGLLDEGLFVSYWSSSLSPGYSFYACILSFNSVGVNQGYDYRHFGYSVRPVCPAAK